MTERDNNLGLEFESPMVNDMDRKFGLWVNTVGYQSIPPRFSLSAEGASVRLLFQCRKRKSILGEYQLVYITRGARFVFLPILLLKAQVCKGRLMVLFPDGGILIIHYGRPDGRRYYIGFEGPAIDHRI